MFEAFIIWLYFAVGNLVFILSIGLIPVGVASLITGVAVVVEGDSLSGAELFKKVLKNWIIPYIIITVLLYSAYPDKDDLKWIIGGALVWNGVEAASDIEGIEELPQNTVDAMNHFLKSIETKGGGNE